MRIFLPWKKLFPWQPVIDSSTDTIDSRVEGNSTILLTLLSMLTLSQPSIKTVAVNKKMNQLKIIERSVLIVRRNLLLSVS